MRSGGGRERALERVSAAEPPLERQGCPLRQRSGSTTDGGSAGAVGDRGSPDPREQSWLSRQCAGCGHTTLRCACVQPAPSVPAWPDDNSAATASLGPAPARASAAVTSTVPAAPPSPPSSTDWSNRYATCSVCHRPAAVCLCMRGQANPGPPSDATLRGAMEGQGDLQMHAAGGEARSSARNPVPSRHQTASADARAAGPRQRAAAAAEARAAAAAGESAGGDGTGAAQRGGGNTEWMISLDGRRQRREEAAGAVRRAGDGEAGAGVGDFASDGPSGPLLPAVARPTNALRAPGTSSSAAASSDDGQSPSSSSRSGGRAERGGTRLTLRVRVPEATATARGAASPRDGGDGDGGNLLGNLLAQAQRSAQRDQRVVSERQADGSRPPGEIRRGNISRPRIVPEEFVRSLSCEGEASMGAMSQKERAIHLANLDMAVAAVNQEEVDSIRKRLERIDCKIPTEMICPISSDIMRDPVMCADGHTYERNTITEWVKRKATSPLTNQPLGEPVMLIPNHALRSLISSYVEDHGGWTAFA